MERDSVRTVWVLHEKMDWFNLTTLVQNVNDERYAVCVSINYNPHRYYFDELGQRFSNVDCRKILLFLLEKLTLEKVYEENAAMMGTLNMELFHFLRKYNN
jgi:hypothetical protein